MGAQAHELKLGSTSLIQRAQLPRAARWTRALLPAHCRIDLMRLPDNMWFDQDDLNGAG